MLHIGTSVKVVMSELVPNSTFCDKIGVFIGKDDESGKLLVKFPEFRFPMKFKASEIGYLN